MPALGLCPWVHDCGDPHHSNKDKDKDKDVRRSLHVTRLIAISRSEFHALSRKKKEKLSCVRKSTSGLSVCDLDGEDGETAK